MHLNKLFFITSVLCFCSCDQLKDIPLPADDLNKTSGAVVQEKPKELEKPNQTKDLIKDDEPTNASDIIATPLPLPPPPKEPEPKPIEAKPQVDLAAAALDAASRVSINNGMDSNSNSIANQDIEWYNKGVGLIEDKKYREALSCFDRALPSFADDDEMVIRILNGRGNALYYLEDYPKCVESYHKAMVINPKGVQGKTLYNMGTAYAEMQRFNDAIKCFEQAIPRGLDKDQQKLAKEQIRRCNILQKEQQRKMG